MSSRLKILAFSDLHCSELHANTIVNRSNEFDFVIGAGDFATARRGIEKTIEILKAITQPTIIVPGNSESVEELTDACSGWDSVHVLHGNGAEIDSVRFFGIGGGIPVTPFGSWSYDFSEEDAANLLADCPSQCVLISHSPPKGAVDISSAGGSHGSVAVRGVIERKKPKLVVCGHIHECWGKTEYIEKTQVVNAGPNGMDLVIEA